MLPKNNRLGKKTVEKVFASGNFFRSFSLSLKFFIDPKKNKTPRVSFIVPKSISKKATERNLLKRRGYRIMKEFFNLLPNGFTGIFIFNTRDKTKNSIKNLKKEIKKFLDEKNIYRPH